MDTLKKVKKKENEKMNQMNEKDFRADQTNKYYPPRHYPLSINSLFIIQLS